MGSAARRQRGIAASGLVSGCLAPICPASSTTTTASGASGFTASVFPDDGKSRRGGLLPDDRIVVSYPDADQGADGTIYLIYDRNRENDREILLARFTAAAVMDANFFNPGSALRLLVNRAAAVRK